VKKTETSFEEVLLHDAPVKSISIHGTTILIELEFARLSNAHPANPHDVTALIEDCRLTFYGVTHSSAKLFSDTTKTLILHPDPTNPFAGELLENTSEAIQGTSRTLFKLEGSYMPGGRATAEGVLAEWEIEAESFDLAWASEFKVWK